MLHDINRKIKLAVEEKTLNIYLEQASKCGCQLLTVKEDLSEGELVMVRAQRNKPLSDLPCLVDFPCALSSCGVAPITAARSHVVRNSFIRLVKHYIIALYVILK